MKAPVVYALVVLAFVALVMFSNHPDRPKTTMHRNLHPGRRLIVRKLNTSKHENVAFDPVVADLERRREERQWEREHFQQVYKQWNQENVHDPAPHPESQPEPDDWDYTDPEEYLNDEDHFNISSRIVTLFPLIDNHPPDGRISLVELQNWHLQAALKEAELRTAREIETYDKNHDGMISFSEYLPHASLETSGNDTTEHGSAGWWKEQFDGADEDGDGLLNSSEFNSFLHPQDSNNKKLHQWLRKQRIKDHDHDNDGKLSFSEFEKEMFDLINLYDEENLHEKDDHLDSASRRDSQLKSKFALLDKNKDGFLTEDELEPIMEALHPGEAYYAKQQAEYLMSQADKNKDGHLTIEEMLENPYVFYSTAYANEDDYEEYYHDEF